MPWRQPLQHVHFQADPQVIATNVQDASAYWGGKLRKERHASQGDRLPRATVFVLPIKKVGRGQGAHCNGAHHN